MTTTTTSLQQQNEGAWDYAYSEFVVVMGSTPMTTTTTSPQQQNKGALDYAYAITSSEADVSFVIAIATS